MATVFRDSLKVSAGGYSKDSVTSFAVNKDENNMISADDIKQTKDRRFATTDQLEYLNRVIEKFSDDENNNLQVEFADRAEDAEYAKNAGFANKSDEANNANFAESAGSVEWDNIQNIPEPLNNTTTFNEEFQELKDNKHLHDNKEVLDLFDVDEDNKVTFNGNDFPYAENSKYAEVAEKANKVKWENVEDIPEALNDSYDLKGKVDSLKLNQHDHTDRDALDLISKNTNNNGVVLPTWNGMKWPGADGDMLASVYDSENNGVVNEARKVKWEGTSEGRPEKFPPEAHTHNYTDIEQSLDTNHRFVTDAEKSKWNLKQDPIGFDSSKIENIDNKGKAGGYAPLRIDRKIDPEYLETTKWNDIENKPSSSVNDIDDAVSKKHDHTLNIDALNKLNKSADNKPTWEGSEWPYPGDMKKSEFVEDGKVKSAKTADNVAWGGIVGKPSSTVSDIDNAVNKSHTHNNSLELEKINKDSDGNPTWNDNEWPYNMKKSEFATNGAAGKVDKAIEADSVKWSGISEGPSSTKADIDDAVLKKHEHSNNSVLNNIDKNATSTRLTFNNNEVALVSDIDDKITSLGNNSISGSVQFDNGKYHLVNDTETVQPNYYYGTGNSGIKGFHKLPEVTVSKSIDKDNNGALILKGDSVPTTMNYYGTDETGTLGYHAFPDKESDEVLASSMRQCVVSALEEYIQIDPSESNKVKLIASENNPIIINFANGKNDIVKSITELNNIVITQNSYIFAKLNNNGNVEFDTTEKKPIYSMNVPASIDGQYWFDLNTYQMKLCDGSNWNKVNVVFLGYVDFDGTNANNLRQFAINGFYDSGYYDVSNGTDYNHNHNIGTDLLFITAYRATNGTNNEIFESTVQGDGDLIGDRVSLVTDLSIKTKRGSVGTFTNSFYGTSNQHRVIIKRAF